MEKHKSKNVTIIGGGLVGSLMANLLAKRGYMIDLYEMREDCRQHELGRGRSINLSLSHRGRKTLKIIGLEEEVLKSAVPMKGRLIHNLNGKTKSILYDGVTHQCLYSVSRNFLNTVLIKALDAMSNVNMKFNHKLTKVSLTDGSLTFMNASKNQIEITNPDLVIAADGAHSKTRKELQSKCKLTYSQTYIEHGYIELQVLPENGHLLTPNHLHIWPRGTFMMIALPNIDLSWTVTLFMPFDIFNSLSTSSKLVDFFSRTFPDFLKCCSEDLLVSDFFRTKPMALVSVKCNPYHFNDKFLLIGDAAHAMVPFYGQGMNAGFEDCSIFNDILDETLDNFVLSVQLFSLRRKDDAHAICDLAMYNYIEMRHLVTTPIYNIRKKLDDFVFHLFPSFWIPLYNSVTFTTMRYTLCVQNRKWQDKVFKYTFICTLLISLTFLLCYFLIK